MLNRTIAPVIKDPVELDIKLPPCEKFTLSNGVMVYALNMGNEDVVLYNFVFYAGNSYETQNTIAPATNYLIKNGTHSRKAFDIDEHFDYYGAYLNRSCYNETAEISLHCLQKHSGELLPVISEILQEAVFPAEELAIYQQNSKQRLSVGLQKSDFVAGRLIDASLFGRNHPYGKYSELVDYDMLQRAQLQQFYKRYYKEGHCVIFVSGKLPADIGQLLDSHFGSLPLKPHHQAAPIVHPVQPSATLKQRVINDEQGVQGSIRIARHFPNRHHPDFQKMMVLNTLFGGFFGSRLMANIREEKGYTYGIYSYLLNHVHQSGLMISTEAGRDVCEATIHEVYAEMEGLCQEPVDEEELQVTRSFMIGSILGDLDGPFQVLSRWKNLVLNGLDEAYFYRGIQTIKTITAAELQEVANKYLVKEDFYELTVI